MSQNSRDVAYQRITDAILEQLDAGTVPWRKPWKVRDYGACRGIAGHEYRGANAFIAEIMRCVHGWNDPRFVTFRAAKQAGGMVRKGEKGVPVIYWSRATSKTETDKDGNPKSFMFAKGYTVFNVEQVDGLELPALEFARPQRAALDTPVPMSGNAPRIFEGAGNCAAYSPGEDLVVMPDRESFDSVEAFTHTLFHELAHSTGHVSRLDRKHMEGSMRFGGKGYAAEELVAEIGSAMVCAVRGVDPQVERSAAYIESWRKVLSADPKLIVTAASRAQKAADFMLNTKAGA